MVSERTVTRLGAITILTPKVHELIMGIISGAGEGTIVFSPTLFIFSILNRQLVA